MQALQKWNQVNRNFQVGDIGRIRDDTIRNEWPIAQMFKTISDKEGLVRSVQLVVGKNSSTSKEM